MLDDLLVSEWAKFGLVRVLPSSLELGQYLIFYLPQVTFARWPSVLLLGQSGVRTENMLIVVHACSFVELGESAHTLVVSSILLSAEIFVVADAIILARGGTPLDLPPFTTLFARRRIRWYIHDLRVMQKSFNSRSWSVIQACGTESQTIPLVNEFLWLFLEAFIWASRYLAAYGSV